MKARKYTKSDLCIERDRNMSKLERNEEIRKLRKEGKGLREIADMFGITRQRVSKIVYFNKKSRRRKKK